MCLWRPNSGERWCVIFSLPEDNTPPDRAIIPAPRQSNCSLLHKSTKFYCARKIMIQGHELAVCVRWSLCVLWMSVYVHKTSKATKISGGEALLYVLVLLLAPFFLTSGQSQVQSSALLTSMSFSLTLSLTLAAKKDPGVSARFSTLSD